MYADDTGTSNHIIHSVNTELAKDWFLETSSAIKVTELIIGSDASLRKQS